MRKVMVHMLNPLRREPGQVPIGQGKQSLPRADLAIEPGGYGVDRIGSSVGRIIEAMSKQVDIVEL